MTLELVIVTGKEELEAAKAFTNIVQPIVLLVTIDISKKIFIISVTYKFETKKKNFVFFVENWIYTYGRFG